MQVNVGDVPRFPSRKVGSAEHHVKVMEVLGTGGEPPYRVRYDDGHESEVFPGPAASSMAPHGAPFRNRGIERHAPRICRPSKFLFSPGWIRR
ncbi:DUF1918 domain-containing protein [Streptomyces virginiae]|uniref:DUF1918 domain-containing protein n=1 Tax=Streptomyces virginiae TaxID=1961 RepID=UPI0036981A6A